MIDNNGFLGVVTLKSPGGVLPQWFAPLINKSPKYLNVAENKFDTGNLFTNGENHRGKISPGDFLVTLPRIHYYQSQVVTNIRNLTKPFDLSRNTNLQLNSYPNTQLDLYCSNTLPVQCTNLST